MTRHLMATVVLIGSLAVATQAQPAGDPLSYRAAADDLTSANETVRAADLLVQQRREEREAAKGLFWPKVLLGVSAVQLSESIDETFSLDPLLSLLPIPVPSVPPITFVIQEERFAEASLNARWLLYTGGKAQAANAAAAARIQDAEAVGQRTTDQLTTSLARLYFGAQLQARVRAVRQQAVTFLDTLSFNARRLEEEGLIARTERLAADVARVEGVRQLSAAESDVELARIALASLLSRDAVGLLVTPLFVNDTLDGVETFVAAMRQQHPALREVQAQQALAGEAARAERGAYKPDVFVFARQMIAEAGVTDLVPYGIYGVAATWTVFDGPERKRKIAAAELQRQRADQIGRRTDRDLATLVQQKYREWVKARDQYRALGPATDLAQENLRARTRAFDEGLSTTLEVVDARLQLSKAQTERLAAAYASIVALAELLEASGQSGRFDEYRAKGIEVGVP